MWDVLEIVDHIARLRMKPKIEEILPHAKLEVNPFDSYHAVQQDR